MSSNDHNSSENDATFSPYPHFGTQAIHVGQDPEQWNSLAVVPPISMSSTFKFKPGAPVS